MERISDEELILNIRYGNREALELLYFRYEKIIGNYIYKYNYVFEKYGYSYEDLKATVWLILDKSINKYSLNNGFFYKYCYTACKSYVIDLLRKRTYETENYKIDEIDELNDLSLCENTPDESFDNSMNLLVDKLLDEVKKMGQIYYDVLKLYYCGYSYLEIAKKLQITTKKVNNILFVIRQKLKDNQFF